MFLDGIWNVNSENTGADSKVTSGVEGGGGWRRQTKVMNLLTGYLLNGRMIAASVH